MLRYFFPWQWLNDNCGFMKNRKNFCLSSCLFEHNFVEFQNDPSNLFLTLPQLSGLNQTGVVYHKQNF